MAIYIVDKEVKYKEVYFDYYPFLCHFAEGILGKREDAEDLVQDLFIKLYGAKLVFNSQSSLKSYLYTSVRNKCIDKLRASSALSRSIPFIPDEDEQNASDRWNDFMNKEMHYRKVYLALKSLPPQSRNVMELILQGKKNKEIAEILNISEGTVKTIKHRSIIAMRKYMLSFFIVYLSTFF